MSSIMGKKLRLSVFGQSHGEAIGAIIDGLPAGEPVDVEQIQAFLDRRAPGGPLATKRREPDVPRFLSGLVNGRTCGAPLCAVIENLDARPGDYPKRLERPRPSHADYPASVRHGGFEDTRGGGHFSGRLTAPICACGAIALQILGRRGVYVGAHLEAVGGARDRRYEPVNLTKQELHLPASRTPPVLDIHAGERMRDEIHAAAQEGDSVGGIIECAAIGLAPGLGEPMFDGIENRLAHAIFGIPGVRGVEFGQGFAASGMRGSAHNDPYHIKDGRVCTKTNRHGGVLGGLSTGMPLIFRVAIKPTPSIARTQNTVNLSDLSDATLLIGGRHDPCIALRAVPVVEAITALALLDFML